MVEHIKRDFYWGGDYWLVNGQYYYSSEIQAQIKAYLLNLERLEAPRTELNKLNDVEYRELILSVSKATKHNVGKIDKIASYWK